MSNNPFLDPSDGSANGAKSEVNGSKANVPDDIFVSLTLGACTVPSGRWMLCTQTLEDVPIRILCHMGVCSLIFLARSQRLEKTVTQLSHQQLDS
jgi:hypothetical protein